VYLRRRFDYLLFFNIVSILSLLPFTTPQNSFKMINTIICKSAQTASQKHVASLAQERLSGIALAAELPESFNRVEKVHLIPTAE
jgi:hypothetical protein